MLEFKKQVTITKTLIIQHKKCLSGQLYFLSAHWENELISGYLILVTKETFENTNWQDIESPEALLPHHVLEYDNRFSNVHIHNMEDGSQSSLSRFYNFGAVEELSDTALPIFHDQNGDLVDYSPIATQPQENDNGTSQA